MIRRTQTAVPEKERIIYDQHYMTDPVLISGMIKALAPSADDTVVEIGPGKGSLTMRLAGRVKTIIAIDIDPTHARSLNSLAGTQIIIGDALFLLTSLSLSPSFKMISNLPYSLCEPLFLLLPRLAPKCCVFTTGRRFYELLLDPSTKLGLMTCSSFDITFVHDVPAAAFSPSPRVQSCTFVLERKESRTEQERTLTSLFRQQDKKLKNAVIKTLRDELHYTNKKAKEVVSTIPITTTEQEGTFAKLSNASCVRLCHWMLHGDKKKKETKEMA